MTKIQVFLDKLSEDNSTDVCVNRTRRLLWLENFPSVNRLRRALKDTTVRMCALLILKHR